MTRSLLFIAVTAAAFPAHAAVTWTQALRTRLEVVDDAAFNQDAWAPTLRYRAGAELISPNLAFGALAEVEFVAGLDGRYNSGANGRMNFPAVTDPTGAELNQAAVFWRGTKARATLGRQRLNFDNQRFIGNSGWRQNEQTFDALDTQFTWNQSSLRYTYLDRVHRVTGDHARLHSAREHALDGHVIHLSRPTHGGTVSTYAYLIDNREVPAAASQSYGVRWTTPSGARLAITLEVARQRDYHTPALDFSHGYRLAEVALATDPLTWRAGWEQLDGDGRHAFQTPLATLHAFNGWADRFTTTPATGLEDRYLSVAGPWAAMKSTWVVAWHDFAPTHASAGRYGAEWNASLVRPLGRGWIALAKVAHYHADHFASDVTKMWIQLEWAR